jgi:DNA-binding GntR family transcriptional regulator
MKDDRHLTRWVAQTLRGQIVSGELAPGDKLPSQKALEGRFKVSTVTVRNAVEELEDEGLIAKRQGAHTQVHDREPTHRLLVPEPSGRLGERPVAFAAFERPRHEWRWLPVVSREPASRHVASLLGLADGDEIEQRSFVLLEGDEPVLKSTSYLPLALADGPAALATGMASDIEVGQFALTGRSLTSVELVLRARMPDPSEFEDLAMVNGTPVHVLTHCVLVGGDGRDGRDGWGAAPVRAAVEVVSRADRVFVQIQRDSD